MDEWEWTQVVWLNILFESPLSVPFFPPHISQRMTRDWNQASAVRGRPLTTWAMAQKFNHKSLIWLTSSVSWYSRITQDVIFNSMLWRLRKIYKKNKTQNHYGYLHWKIILIILWWCVQNTYIQIPENLQNSDSFALLPPIHLSVWTADIFRRTQLRSFAPMNKI